MQCSDSAAKSMTPDEYLNTILIRETINTGPYSPVRGVQATLDPLLQRWAGNRLVDVHPSGSFMKGTANLSGTDIDLFVSLSDQTTETLKEIYDKLFNFMKENGYLPSRQNVSINLRVNGYSVDLVPAKRQNSFSDDHSLYRRRADTWTKTNVVSHINHVIGSGRQNEIRVLKLWRDQKQLSFFFPGADGHRSSALALDENPFEQRLARSRIHKGQYRLGPHRRSLQHEQYNFCGFVGGRKTEALDRRGDGAPGLNMG